MPIYEFDTPDGILEFDHDGDPAELIGAVEKLSKPKPPLLLAEDFRPKYEPTKEDIAAVQQASATGRPVVIQNGVATVGDEVKQPDAAITMGDTLARGAASVAKGAALTGQGALYAAETLKPQFDLSGGRQFLRDVEERAAEDYQVDPTRDTALTSKVIDVAGQMVPIMASGGTLAPITSAAIMGESQRRDAEEAGATKEQQQAAFGIGAATGVASEALLGLPALLKSAKAGAAGVKTIGRQAGEQGLKGFFREGAQEAIEQAGGNVTASTIIGYDPERPAMKGVGEAAFLGGLVGGPMGAGVQVLAGKDAAIDAALQARKLDEAKTELGKQLADFPTATYEGTAPAHPNDVVVKTVRKVSGPVNAPVEEIINTYQTSEPTVLAAMKLRAVGAPATAEALTSPPKPFSPVIEEAGGPAYGRELDVFDATDGLQRKSSAEAAQDAPPSPITAEKAAAGQPLAEPVSGKAGPPVENVAPQPTSAVPSTAEARGGAAPIKMVAAAYELPDGTRFTGIDHMDANMKADEVGAKIDDSMAGFIGEDGKFYNREAAYQAAKGQIDKQADTFKEGQLHTGKLIESFDDLADTTGKPPSELATQAEAPVSKITPRIAEGKTTQDIVSDAMDAAGTPADAWQNLQTQIDHPRTSEADRGKMRDAQRKIANALESEARREAELQAEGDLSGTYELISSVKELGGLPATSEKGKESGGELSRIKEAQKGAAMALFRKGGKSLDTLREALAERGFQFETANDMLAAIEDSMRSGTAVRGTQFPEGYQGGPGAMSPTEAGEMSAGQKKLGGYNADVEASQKARGQTPTLSEARKEDPVTFENAMAVIEDNPDAPEMLVERIKKEPQKPITDEEQQMLTWRRADLENKMAMESDRAVDFNTTPEARAAAQAQAEFLETKLLETEEANRIAGTASGRSLRSRQLEMNDDFTFAGLMRRERKMTGAEVPMERRNKIKEDADAIAKAQKEADIAVEAETKRNEDADLDAKIAAYQRESEKVSGGVTYHPSILDQAEKLVQGIEAQRDEMRKVFNLREFFGSKSGAVGGVGGPKGEGRKMGEANRKRASAIKALSLEIAAMVSRFGLNRAKVLERVVTDFGENARPFFGKAYEAGMKLVTGEKRKVPTKVKEAVEGGAVNPEKKTKPKKSKDELVGQGRADIEAGDGLSHKTVAEIVNGFIDSGIRDREKLFKMSHDVVKEFMPEATERDVRRAYVQYGKKTFPNPDEIATFKRNVRQAAKIEEDIARLENEKLRPEKQGYQRDKIDIQIRDLQKKRGELLKNSDLPPEPGAFASKDEAKQTRIKNRIEEINRELATGEKTPGGTPPAPDSIKTEQLRAELAAMEEKLREVRAIENPPLSPAQKALDSALVARERAAQTLDDIAGGKLKPDAKAFKEAMTQLEEDVRLETDALKQLAAEMRRDAKPKTDPSYLKEQAQINALERAIEMYAKKQRNGDFASKGKVQGPDSQIVTQLKEIRDSRAAAYRAARDAGKPVLTPEQRYNAQRLKALEKRDAELTERLRTGDVGPRPKKIQPKLENAALDAQAKVKELQEQIKMEFRKQELAKRPLWKKALGQLAQIRGVILGSDIGVLTRQGAFSWSRPQHAIPSLVNAAKAAMSPDSAKRWEVRMQNRKINGEPVAPIRKAANLQTTDTLNHPEELVITQLLSRIPDVKVGNRTVKLSAIGRTFERFQTTFINDARMRTFDAGVKAGLTPEELKTRAHLINNVTGRGNMKYVPEILTTIMTSPRYESSRWGTIAEPARNIITLAKNLKNREPLNRGALANLQDLSVTSGSLMALMWMVAEWSDYDLNLDPYSSDFLKLRKGDEVWDLSAGIAPRIRDVMRIQQAMLNPDRSSNFMKIGAQIAGRTINPAIKTGIDQASVLKQRKIDGNDEPILPFTGFRSDEEREGLITLAPLIWQSGSQAWREDGPGAAAWTASREFIGQSVSRYPAPKE